MVKMGLAEFSEKTAFIWLCLAVIAVTIIIGRLIYPLERRLVEFIAKSGEVENLEKEER